MPTAKQLPVLTGLRGVAAYVVLLAHAVSFVYREKFPAEMTGLTYFGMSLFFVLSGFVIYYNYADIRGAAGAYRFFVARFARLYPLYVVMLAVSWLRFPDPAPFDSFWASPLAALSGLTLTQSWFNLHGISGTTFGQSWSISTEWFFYAAFPLLCIPVAKIRRPVRALVVWTGIAVAAMGVIAIYQDAVSRFAGLLVGDKPPLSAPPWVWFIYASPILRTLEFIAGMLACRAYFDLSSQPIDARVARFLLALCFAWMAASLAGSGLVEGWRNNDIARVFTHTPAIAPAILLLCLVPTFTGRVLSGPVFWVMGETSYAVYALQFFVFAMLAVSGAAAWGRGVFCFAVIAAVGLLAVPTYWLFEKPARLFLRRLLTPRNPVALQAAQ
jgi:peptidoglycan/LPS O-acetylase OafA/YrhL